MPLNLGTAAAGDADDRPSASSARIGREQPAEIITDARRRDEQEMHQSPKHMRKDSKPRSSSDSRADREQRTSSTAPSAQPRSRSLLAPRADAMSGSRGDLTSSATWRIDGDDDGDDTAREEGQVGGRNKTRRRRRSASPAGDDGSLAALSRKTKGSDSSSGSGSTITQVSFTRRESTRPDALSFLDPDSPAVTDEAIQRTVAEASGWHGSMPSHEAGGEPKTSPSARSSSSSSSLSSGSFRSSDDGSEAPLADHDTDRSTSPEHSDAGSPTPRPTPNPKAHQHQHRYYNQDLQPSQQLNQYQQARQERVAHKYGTPEMPRGNANLPHLPPGALNPPRMPVMGQHVKHLPRAEKLPLTGYELLAARLASHPPAFERPRTQHSSHSSSPSATSSRRGSIGGASVRSFDEAPRLRPIYRRFEALNHRLLLHLQDELAELEEQLHRLDTADTQTRRLANRILPASRRAEYMAGGELQWHKTDILGKIGYKLGQYNHVLSSFTETQRLTTPSLTDVETYRTYLATQQPIAEIETRFLDPAEDLVTLAPQLVDDMRRSPSPAESAVEYLQRLDGDDGSSALTTPMPRTAAQSAFLASPVSSSPSRSPSASPASSVRGGSSRPGTARRDGGSHSPEGMTIGTTTHPTLPLLSSSSSSPLSGAAAAAGSITPHLAIAVAVAVLVPILTFAVIPGFVGRMTVVLLVAFAVFGAQVQAGTVRLAGRTDLLLCASVYGGVMAVVAGLFA